MKPLRALIASAGAVAVATGLIYALRPVAPDLSLGVLYVLPVMAIAVAFGVVYALGCAVASMLAFNFFFLPPVHNFSLRDSENWVALGVYLGTAIVVGQLAAQVRRRAREAEQREREATLVAGVSLGLLRSEHVQEELRGIAARTAEVRGAKKTRPTDRSPASRNCNFARPIARTSFRRLTSRGGGSSAWSITCSTSRGCKRMLPSRAQRSGRPTASSDKPSRRSVTEPNGLPSTSASSRQLSESTAPRPSVLSSI
jgi:hypothetical protein